MCPPAQTHYPPVQNLIETPASAFEYFYGGQFTLSTQLRKPIYQCYGMIFHSRGLKKWISVARQKQTNPIPEPSAVELPGNKQLQKLLAKEEQRLEQEQKRAAIERRRKQQQDKFQLQHELNHPLRQRPKILKGGLINLCILFASIFSWVGMV